MTPAAIELVAVEDAARRATARELIAEHLRCLASVGAGMYGLSFDIGAMVTSDIEDQAKFYPPSGRFHVLRRDDATVGGGCLKRITPPFAELRSVARPRPRRRSAKHSMTKYQPLGMMDRYRSSAVSMELRLYLERMAGDDPPLPAR